MKRQLISLFALTLIFAFIFSCAEKKDSLPAKPEVQPVIPDSIVIDTLKVDSLITEIIELDTLFVDTLMIDSFSIDTSKVIPSEQTETSFWNDIKIMGLKGNLRSLSETTYKAQDKFGEIVKGQITGKSSVILFETTGMIKEEQYFDPKGKPLSTKKNMYDSKGNKIENAFRPDGKLDNSKKISYDSKGNITEETIYNPQGLLESKYKYKYIDRKLTEACLYNSEGNISNIELYGYDINGNKTEESFYNSEGELIDSHKFIIETDEEGDRNVKDIFVTDGVENISWEKFSREGYRVAQGSGRSGDEKSSFTEYKYDASGNVIEETGNDPVLYLKYEYEYDAAGNWVKKTAYEKKSLENKIWLPKYITERTITYYE